MQSQVDKPSALVAEGLSYRYPGCDVDALRDVSLEIPAGELVAVRGRSGCGKSTLLHVLAGILAPRSGSVSYGDVCVSGLKDAARSGYRLAHFGLVFQFGDLVPELTLAENVELPLRLSGWGVADARARAAEMLGALEVDGLAGRQAGEVSGGQLQRAAVARALAGRPDVIFADEPTGALDSAHADGVMGALVDICRRQGAAAVIVTHDDRTAGFADRSVVLVDGQVAA